MLSDPFDSIIGRSAAAEAIRTFGRRAAAVDAPVLLLGETGTGKGVLARAIHDGSARSRAPFVSVNCAAIPESLFESEFFGHVRGAFTGAQYAHKGLIEQAHGGTLFLDEVGELPLMAQAKLLTAIEDRVIRRVGGERVAHANVRIIAATAIDLSIAVAHKSFRRDLYHRLSVLQFTIPPLRNRHGDISTLASVFINHFAERYGKQGLRMSADAAELLSAAEWPGNVRELAHTLEAAVLACESETIHGAVLHQTVATKAQPPYAPTMQRRGVRYSYHGTTTEELQVIERVLARCSGNKTRAAAELGMSRNTLLSKLRRQDIQTE